jgi:hypothetical protein
MRRIAIFFLAMVVVCIGLAILSEEWADGDLARLFYVGAYACTLITAPAIIVACAERMPSRKKATTRDEERSCVTVSEPHLSGVR